MMEMINYGFGVSPMNDDGVCEGDEGCAIRVGGGGFFPPGCPGHCYNIQLPCNFCAHCSFGFCSCLLGNYYSVCVGKW